MTASMALTSSLEDYLEVIYHLIRREHEARAKQVADELKVKKSSVTVALRALAKKKLINYSPYSDVTLTAQGELVAEDIVRRHETLKEFFTTVLAVDEEQAEDSACKMEHALSKDMTERLIRFLEFINICPRHGTDWIEKYHRYCGGKQAACDCVDCMDQTKNKLDALPRVKEEKESMNALSSLEPGQKAEIVKITHKGFFRRRILEMGVTAGAVLTVERVAPLGDPVDIKIRGYHLSIRKEESKNIMVKIIQ